jgi:putative transposase
MSFVEISDAEELSAAHRGWLEDALDTDGLLRESRWTETIAVGSRRFVEGVGEKLGVRAAGREVLGERGSYELREPDAAYSCNFESENGLLSPKNAYFWKDY